MPKVVREYKIQARSRIIDAAVLVVHRDGLGGATMDAIARELGVSKGALYLYFPSKTAVLAAILERFREEMIDRFERAAETGDVAEAIAGAVDRVFSGEFNPSVWHQLFADAAADPEVREALRVDQERDSKHMRAFLQRLEARGRIPRLPNPDAAADAVLMLLGGTFVQVSLHGNPADSRRRLIRSIRLVLGMPLTGGTRPSRSRRGNATSRSDARR